MHLSRLFLPLLFACSARVRTPPEVPRIPVPMVKVVRPVPDLSLPPAERLVPIGGWIRIEGRVGWIYVDPFAGPTLRWHELPSGGGVVSYEVKWRPRHLETLSAADIVAAQLPSQPSWLSQYGEQPPPGSSWGEWRLDPVLMPFLDAQDPDLMPVWIHDGTRDAVEGVPEQVWVRVVGCGADVCSGVVLTAPDAVRSASLGDRIDFEKSPAWKGEHAFLAGR